MSLPNDILPYPKVAGRRPVKTANRGKAAILTSSPYKDELNASLEAKRLKLPTSKLPSLKGKGLLKGESVKKTSKPQKKGSTEKKTDEATNKTRDQKDVRREDKTKEKNTKENSDDEENPVCFYCEGDFLGSKPGDQWIRCSSCQRWVHEACGPLTNETHYFICDLCLEI